MEKKIKMMKKIKKNKKNIMIMKKEKMIWKILIIEKK